MPLTLASKVKNKMITNLLIGFAVIVVLAVLVIAMQSNDFRVTRSTLISAPPSEVFSQINDHHKFEVWSPFNKMDPNIQRTIEGPSAGTGSIYRWSGNKDVGEGSCTIVDSRPDEMVRMRLEFVKPFVGVNDVVFTIKPEGEQTKLTWDMTGKRNFMMKAMGLLMNMDKMCGGQFEKGLSNLKSVVESGSLAKS
jgi:hypothetical protein